MHLKGQQACWKKHFVCALEKPSDSIWFASEIVAALLLEVLMIANHIKGVWSYQIIILQSLRTHLKTDDRRAWMPGAPLIAM